MAKANQQRAELDETLVINQMVADTEREIFDEAMGADPLDLDGDTSLETMGEGLEGEDLETEGDEEEAEGEAEESEEAGVPPGYTTRVEGDEEEGEEEGEGGEEPLELPPRDNRGALREERERRRTLEARLAEKDEQFNALNTRMDTVLAQLASGRAPQAPQPPQPTEQLVEPDMFIDQNGWKDWNRKQAEQVAREAVQQSMSEFERRQQQRSMMGIDETFEQAANGPRGVEFLAAYRNLTSLPKNEQSGKLVTRILGSRDPVTAVFDWWEENGGPEFREQAMMQLADQLGLELPEDFAPPPTRRAQGNTRRVVSPRGQQPQPRHETRLPQPMRSLNSVAGGGGPRRDVDARAFDGSEQAIFAYGTGQDV